MKSEWITCQNCEDEFRVITDSLVGASYCPLCGSAIEDDDLEDDDWD